MVYLNQLNYKEIPYEHNIKQGGPAPGRGNVAAAGCGLCCLCMIAGNLTTGHLDLLDCLALSAEHQANLGAGTDLRILGSVIAKRFGLDFKMTDAPQDLAEHLRRGGMAVANSGGDREGYTGVFTHGGHYITVVSVDGNEVCILDPSYQRGKYEEGGRKGKVRVCDPFAYCDMEVLAKDCENRSPAFYLFKRKNGVGITSSRKRI